LQDARHCSSQSNVNRWIFVRNHALVVVGERWTMPTSVLQIDWKQIHYLHSEADFSRLFNSDSRSQQIF
jgi:hypothetical protein